MMRWLPICLAIAVAAGSASAKAPQSCSVLSQISMSSWLQLLDGLGDNTVEARDFTRLHNLTGSYANLGCDVAALRQSMDCVLDRAGTGASRDVARACLVEFGLTEGE